MKTLLTFEVLMDSWFAGLKRISTSQTRCSLERLILNRNATLMVKHHGQSLGTNVEVLHKQMSEHWDLNVV